MISRISIIIGLGFSLGLPVTTARAWCDATSGFCNEQQQHQQIIQQQQQIIQQHRPGLQLAPIISLPFQELDIAGSIARGNAIRAQRVQTRLLELELERQQMQMDAAKQQPRTQMLEFEPELQRLCASGVEEAC